MWVMLTSKMKCCGIIWVTSQKSHTLAHLHGALQHYGLCGATQPLASSDPARATPLLAAGGEERHRGRVDEDELGLGAV